MKVSRKEHGVLSKILAGLVQENVLSEAESERLKGAVTVVHFDFRRLAWFSLLSSLICVIISISAFAADAYVRRLLEFFVNMPDNAKSLLLMSLSGAGFRAGWKLRQRFPYRVFSCEMVNFAATAVLGVAFVFMGTGMGLGADELWIMSVFSSVVYGCIAYAVESSLIALLALLNLGYAMGAYTGYVSGWGAYFLGMNYPLRFVVFGGGLVALSMLLPRVNGLKLFFIKTLAAVGLLYLFLALWILSIWGHSAGSFFDERPQVELALWAIVFGGAACGSFYMGLRRDDGMFRGFGITFFFINLYTKFFEVFWEGVHKGVFFGLIGLSFWVLGTQAEKIGQLKSLEDLKRLKRGLKVDEET